MIDEIMTVADVARYLKLKPQTIYKWLQDGMIPAAKLGKEWRFKKSVIDAWFDAQIAKSPAMPALDDKGKSG